MKQRIGIADFARRTGIETRAFGDYIAHHLPAAEGESAGPVLVLSQSIFDPHILPVVADLTLEAQMRLGIITLGEYRASLPNEPMRLARTAAERLESEAAAKAKAAVEARQIVEEMEAAST